jgi:hypothetical protein
MPRDISLPGADHLTRNSLLLGADGLYMTSFYLELTKLPRGSSLLGADQPSTWLLSTWS